MNHHGIKNNIVDMKKIEQYISEHILKGHLKKQYKYYPKTKEELIENICAELNDGNTNLNCIDTSKIDDMFGLFDQDDGIKLTDEQQKTLDISDWNVSNVENMGFIFYGRKHFNCDLSNWNVSNVTNMSSMFAYCQNFNSDLSNWNVSRVENMHGMFRRCEHFNCDLSKWDVSKVESMSGMFEDSNLEGNEPSWYKK